MYSKDQHALGTTLPGWRDTIGRVIRPELLEHKKLNPTHTDHHSQTLFGIEIDLEAIEQPEFAISLAKLREKRENLLAEESSTKMDLEAWSKLVIEKKAALNSVDLRVRTSTTRVENLSEKIQEMGLLYQQKSDEFKEVAAERGLTVDKEIQNKKILKAEQESVRENKVSELEKASFELKMEFEANAAYEISKIEQTIEGQNELIVQDYRRTLKQIEDLKSAFAAMLKNKGIDEAVEASAKAEKDRLVKKCESIELIISEINQYNTWVDTQWSQITRFTQEMHQAEKRATEAEQNLIDTEKASEKTIHELKETLEQLEQRIQKAQDQVSLINKSRFKLSQELIRVAPVKNKPEIQEVHDIEFYCQHVDKSVVRVESLQIDIGKKVRRVSDTLNAISGKNQVKQIWDEMKEARYQSAKSAGNETITTNNDEFMLMCLPDLETLFHKSIPDLRDTLTESVKTKALLYSNFYNTLDDVNKKIRTVSSRLEKSIQTHNPFPAIDDIEVHLTSKIHDYGMWADLSHFNTEWNNWQKSSQSELPGASFVQSFRAVVHAMKDVRISKELDSLVGMEITVVENGRPAKIRSDDDLEKVGSEGISKLAIIVVFCGMTRYLCSDDNVTIHWPVDELGKISHENVGKLFNLMSSRNISLFTAQPDPHAATLKYFTTKNQIAKGVGVKSYIDIRSDKTNPLLTSHQQEGS